jgi:hypothetical protein
MEGGKPDTVPRCWAAGRGGLAQEDANLLHAPVQDWPDPLESCLLDPSAQDELEVESNSDVKNE